MRPDGPAPMMSLEIMRPCKSTHRGILHIDLALNTIVSIHFDEQSLEGSVDFDMNVYFVDKGALGTHPGRFLY